MSAIKVLIIDDCPTSTGLLIQDLEKMRFAVAHHRVDNAESLRAQLDHQEWDLILSKPVLKRLDCFSALESVKRQGRDVPFIIVADSMSEEVASMAALAGAHDYVERNQATRLRLAVVRELRKAEARREQRRAQQALKTAHQHLLDIIEALPDATFILDEAKRVIVWNRACEELAGVGRGEMLGKDEGHYALPFYGKRQPMLIDLLDTPFDEVARTYDHVSRIGNQLHAATFAPLLNQGQGAYLSTVAAPLCDQEGKRFGAIQVIRNISEQHRLEDDFRKAQKIAVVGLLAGGARS